MPRLRGAVVEVVAFLFEGPGVDLGSDLHQVMAAVGHVLPFVALAPVRIAHQFAEELEVMIVEGVQDDVAVARLQPAHGRRAVRHPRPGRFVVAGAGQKRRHQADHHVLHGDVDPGVAGVAAFVEEGSDRQRGHQTGVVAGLMAAQGDRRAVDVAGPDRHLVDQSAAVSEREFAGGRSRAGSREAVGRDRRDDQVRRRLRRRFAVDDQGVGGSGAGGRRRRDRPRRPGRGRFPACSCCSRGRAASLPGRRRLPGGRRRPRAARP